MGSSRRGWLRWRCDRHVRRWLLVYSGSVCVGQCLDHGDHIKDYAAERVPRHCKCAREPLLDAVADALCDAHKDSAVSRGLLLPQWRRLCCGSTAVPRGVVVRRGADAVERQQVRQRQLLSRGIISTQGMPHAQ